MTILEWTLTALLITLYIAALFTICLLTFRKGHWMFGILGIFFPLFWLIGAILPARPGSAYDRDERMRQEVHMAQTAR